MTVSSGHLDSLLNMSFSVGTIANLTYQSGSATNGAVNSVTAKTGATTYPTFDTMTVTSVDDSNNNIVVTGYYTSGGGGYYGGGGTTTAVPWIYTVVGKVGNDLLLAANGAAALTSVPVGTVAADIQSGNSAVLSNDLFIFAIDNNNVGSGQTVTFSSFAQAAPSAETVAQVTASAPSSAVTVTDSSTNVQTGLDALQSLAANGKITAITLTDPGTPPIIVSDAQLTSDAAALAKLSGNYTLSVTDVPVAQASTVANTAHVGLTVVKDSSANVAAALDGLQSLVSGGHTLSITLTDGGTPNITLTAAQFTADKAVLNDITSGHSVTVQMSGTAAAHNFTGENWAGATDLQFSDMTVFAAATPGPANAVTTGNVTELYSAVLAREPDVGGLAFYQNFLKGNPNTSLQTFATFFLNSSEYTSNSAHNYAQTTAGDQQFITDSYQNLLHRTPSASEVSFYETNVLAPAVAGLTAGTQAYASAQQQAHALMLVYFSASSEFLGDVQITASNPASASHWLLLS